MLIPLSELYLDMILEWRNQEEVRKFSFNDHLISKEEHKSWWEIIKKDPGKKWMIYSNDGQPAGVVNFYDIKPGKEAYWGFYFSDQFDGYEKLKLWYAIEKEAIRYAFEELQLKTLKCEIFKFNKAALFMHKNTGYREIDTYQHAKGKVIILELESLS